MEQELIQLIREFSDRSIKWLLETPDNVRGLLLAIASDLAKRIDYSKLEKIDKTFIHDDFRKREADILFTVPFIEDPEKPNQEVIIFILIEQQSDFDPTMAFRIFHYMAQIWEMQRREFEGQKKPINQWRFQPIVPIVFYTGREDWKTPIDMRYLVELPASLEQFIPKYEVLFLNLKTMSSNQLIQDDHPFGWILRVIQEGESPLDKFSEALHKAIEHLEKMPLDERINWEKLIIFLLAFIYHRREPEEVRELINILETNVVEKSRREEVKKMGESMAQLLIEEGKEIGREIGKEIGSVTAKHDYLIRLLKFRFRSLPQEIIEKIESIEKIDQLDAIFECILNVDTIEELNSELLKY